MKRLALIPWEREDIENEEQAIGLSGNGRRVLADICMIGGTVIMMLVLLV